MHWLMALSIVTGLAAPPPTRPGFFEAPKLMALCTAKGPDAAAAKAICLGYVVGATDQLLQRQGRRNRPTVCPPPDVSATDALQAVLRHERVGSAATAVGAADYVRVALEQAWPCASEGGRSDLRRP